MLIIASPLSPTLSRVAAVRAATREAHDGIESLASMRRLVSADYTLDEYRVLLKRLHAYVAALEEKFEATPADRLNLARARTPRLLADLAALDAEPLATALNPLGALKDIDFADASNRAAVLYVMEGSSLGGQVIRRALFAHLGPAVSQAVSYFDCYDGTHGSIWRRTMATIEQHPDLCVERMGSTAALIFATLTRWLQPGAPSSHHGLLTAGVSRCPFSRLSKWAGQWI